MDMALPSGQVLYLTSPSNVFKSEINSVHPVIDNLGHSYATPYNGQFGFKNDSPLSKPQVMLEL